MKLIFTLFFISILFIHCAHFSHEEDLELQLINNESQVLEIHTDYPNSYLAMLDHDQLSKIKKTPSSLNLRKIKLIKKLNFEMRYDQTVDTIQKIFAEIEIQDQIYKAEYLLEYLFASQNIFSYEKDYIDKLKLLKNLRFNSEVLALYYYILYLIDYQDYLRFHNQSFHALSCVEYAMHCLETSEYKDKMPFVKGLLYRIKGSLLINEAHPGAQETAIRTLNRSLVIFRSIKKLNDEAITLINLANIYENGENVIGPDSLISYLEPKLESLSPRVQSYYYLNLGFILEDNGKPEASLNYLQQAYAKLSNYRCTRTYFDICNILAESYVGLKQIKEAERFLKEMGNYKDCNFKLLDFIEFYESDVLYGLNKLKLELGQELKLEELISPLIKRRDIAKKIFKNQREFHLDDFYTENCSFILEELNRNFDTVIPMRYHALVLSLLSDTKKRDLRIKKHKLSDISIESIAKDTETTIENCLSILEDFNEIDDYSNEIYSTLFQAFNNRLNNTSKIRLDESFNNSDSVAILEYVNSKNSSIVDFLVYDEDLFEVTYSGSTMLLSKYYWPKIKNALTEQMQIITNKKIENNFVTSKLLDKLNFKYSDSSELLLLSPDNLLSVAPLEYLLSADKKMIDSSRFTNLKQKGVIDTTFVSGDSFCIFSYSDSSTLNSSNIKKLPELYYGHKEALEIHALFTYATLFSGEDLNKDNFISNAGNDILHIITHGYSYSDTRQDCFLVGRSKNDTSAIRLAHLKLIESPPKFVCLSSCNSGTGSYVIGTGVFSLSRGFLEIGTQTVLKTLWKIDDQASQEFMVSFYTNWKSGISVAEALHMTKLECKNSKGPYTHPYYWAGFVLEGNPNMFLTQ